MFSAQIFQENTFLEIKLNFSLTGKCFSLTNFYNDKQIQKSLDPENKQALKRNNPIRHIFRQRNFSLFFVFLGIQACLSVILFCLLSLASRQLAWWLSTTLCISILKKQKDLHFTQRGWTLELEVSKITWEILMRALLWK